MTRTIRPAEFVNVRESAAVVLDVRRGDDYNGSGHIVSGSVWKDPGKIEDWIDSIPAKGQVIIYCARGGGVSNSVVDSLLAVGVDAGFVEGGIEALREFDGVVVSK